MRNKIQFAILISAIAIIISVFSLVKLVSIERCYPYRFDYEPPVKIIKSWEYQNITEEDKRIELRQSLEGKTMLGWKITTLKDEIKREVWLPRPRKITDDIFGICGFEKLIIYYEDDE